MTTNQINYWNLQESRRHNVVSEGETQRHNVVTETETNRHNVATEAIDISKLQETHRHNVVTEGQQDRALDIQESGVRETQRHNQATENIDIGKLMETTRHNQAQEQIGKSQVDLGYANVGLGYANVGLGYSQLGETSRHNTALEDLQASRNAAMNELDKAKTAFQNTQNLWEDAKSQVAVQQGISKVNQINMSIEKMKKEMEKMDSDMKLGNYHAANETANTVIKGLDSLNDIINSWR